MKITSLTISHTYMKFLNYQISVIIMLYELGMGGIGMSKPIQYFESKANVFDIFVLRVFLIGNY